jgi:hypothetical protein
VSQVAEAGFETLYAHCFCTLLLHTASAHSCSLQGMPRLLHTTNTLSTSGRYACVMSLFDCHSWLLSLYYC